MEKKYFVAPYLKVVEVKNDILTSSVGFGDDLTGPGQGNVQGRHGMWDDDFSGENYY